jgi:acetyl/propionyl-CoA carboxylase alpha subunit
MKVVRDGQDLPAAAEQARREAMAAFGDGTLYVERLIERPRHIEVQVLADAHGTVLHLFERECSLQRRHQKVVEETPSPAVTPVLRRRLGDAAVAVARAAGYRNAGTVEFLVEGGGDKAAFYFLEMNARLQVEHPITEAVTGVDLVRAQLAVAAGERLAIAQPTLAQRGHAIEVRIYAEDPSRDFLPQAGRLLLYRAPSIPGVRIDAGIGEGDEVPIHYDPLLVKLIAAADTREAARQKVIAALREFPILGVVTNAAYLLEVLQHPRFVAGDLDTHLLSAEHEQLVSPLRREPPAIAVRLAAAARGAAPGVSSDTGHTWRDPWE